MHANAKYFRSMNNAQQNDMQTSSSLNIFGVASAKCVENLCRDTKTKFLF